MRLNKTIVNKAVRAEVAKEKRAISQKDTYEFDMAGALWIVCAPVTLILIFIGCIMFYHHIEQLHTSNAKVWDRDCSIIASGQKYFVTKGSAGHKAACIIAPNWAVPVLL